MHGVAPIAGGFLVQWIWGMDQGLAQYGADGKLVRAVSLPAGIAIGTIASSAASPEALIAYSGWTIPERWARYDARTGAAATVFEVQPAGDYSKVAVSRVDALSKDGTPIPVTILSLHAAPRDGSAPAVLTSYGGFDLPVTPTFLGPWLAWLEHGGVLAYANIRGGDEFGETWHRQGMLRQKQNVFDDFFAAAEALVREKWAAPRRLGIMGRSNGGLLMGTVLTEHPEAFRAVAAFVGIYDMTRHKEIPNGQYNIPEYGTADDSADFAAQYGYSALYHVKAGERYPAVLLETGANDPLVAPWQSREFAAALQSATGSGRPVLLRTRLDQGHAAASFAQAMGNTTMMMTFLAHELGLRQ
jgi:prolyl oligopeptidase